MNLNFTGMFSQLLGTCLVLLIKQLFEKKILFHYFCAILYFEPSVDIFKILSAVGTPSSLADSSHNCM